MLKNAFIDCLLAIAVVTGLSVSAQSNATLYTQTEETLVLSFEPNSVNGANGLFASNEIANPSYIPGNPATEPETYFLGGADDFELPFYTTIASTVFWTLEELGAVWDETLRYAIWQDSGAGVPVTSPALAFGDYSNLVCSDFGECREGGNEEIVLTREKTGKEITTWNGFYDITYDQYKYSFALESAVGLSGNTRYWLSIYLGQARNLDKQISLLWNQTTTPVDETFAVPMSLGNANVAPWADAIWRSPGGSGNSLAFQLYKVPAPGTLSLIVPILLLFISMTWRRANV